MGMGVAVCFKRPIVFGRLHAIAGLFTVVLDLVIYVFEGRFYHRRFYAYVLRATCDDLCDSYPNGLLADFDSFNVL